MKKWGVLILLSLSTFIIVIDTTIMNVSISALVNDLNTTVSGIQGAISIYALVMASFIMIGGKLADIFGKKRVFIAGLVFFGIGTFTASLSTSLIMLIIGWSIIEGIGAALMFPNLQTILRDKYQDADRALGYAILGAVGAIGAAVGPIAGGFLTTFFTWRYAFALEVIIVIAVLLMTFLIKKDVIEKIKPKFDFVGALLTTIGLGTFVLGVLLIQTYGLWLAKKPFMIFGMEISIFGLSIVPFIIAFSIVILLILFKWAASKEKQNQGVLFHPSIFNIKGFLVSVITRSTQMMILAGVLFSLPLFMQISLEFNAIETGIGLIPFSISVLISALLGAKLSKSISANRLIQGGFLLIIIGAFLLAITIENVIIINNLIIPTSIIGFGSGLIASQIVNFILSLAKKEQTSEASGINGTFEQLGNSVGVAIIGTLLIITLSSYASQQIYDSNIIPAEYKQEFVQAIEKDTQILDNSSLNSALTNAGIENDEIKNEILVINQNARSVAFKSAMVFTTIIGLTGFVTSFYLPIKRLDKSE